MGFVHTEPADSQFYGHPRVVNWNVDEEFADVGIRATYCHVLTGRAQPVSLYVREVGPGVVTDGADGGVHGFGSLDAAIEWALRQ